MQTKVITMPSAKIREVARVAMEGCWMQIALFMGLYYLINTGIANVLDLFFVTHQSLPLPDGQTIEQTVYYGSSIYLAVVGGPLSWALSKFLLDFFRYQKIDQTTLLEGFSCFGKTLVLMLLTGIRVFLWSLLFIIPGIIATFRYSQAFYVMVDHPEYSAGQCLAESSRIMSGNKMKYFYLYLSFIGWNLLAMLPAFCFSTQIAAASGILYVLLDLVFAIPVFFLNAYMNMAFTVFYELATDNLTIVMEEDPEVAVPVQESSEDVIVDVPFIEEPKADEAAEAAEESAETETFKLPEE